MGNSSAQEKALNVILVMAVVLLLPEIVKRGYSRAHLFIFIYTIFDAARKENRQLRLEKLIKGKASLLNVTVRAALPSVLDDKLSVLQKILRPQDAPAAVRTALHTLSP